MIRFPCYRGTNKSAQVAEVAGADPARLLMKT
nr:MAG TPA: hypothetical protein [Caudoviricetes sp.]